MTELQQLQALVRAGAACQRILLAAQESEDRRDAIIENRRRLKIERYGFDGSGFGEDVE